MTGPPQYRQGAEGVSSVLSDVAEGLRTSFPSRRDPSFDCPTLCSEGSVPVRVVVGVGAPAPYPYPVRPSV